MRIRNIKKVECRGFLLFNDEIIIFDFLKNWTKWLSISNLEARTVLDRAEPLMYNMIINTEQHGISGNGDIFRLKDLKKIDLLSSRISYLTNKNVFRYSFLIGHVYKKERYNGEKSMGIYDLSKGKLLWERVSEGRYGYMNEGYVYLDDGYNEGTQNTITKHDLYTGEVIWEFYKEKGFKEFLGDFKDVLMLRYDDGVIGISKSTGEELWYAKHGTVFIEEIEKIVYLAGPVYKEVDPLTGEEKQFDVDDSVFKARPLVPKLMDDKLVARGEGRGKALGVFDLKTKKYIWKYELENGIFLADRRFLQVDGNRIYAQTSNDELYVFEAQEESEDL